MQAWMVKARDEARAKAAPCCRGAPDCIQGIPDLRRFQKGSPPGYVYFLVDGDEVVYVGKTHHLRNRMRRHQKDKLFTVAFYVPVDVDDMGDLESFYIEQLQPKYNRQGVTQSVSLPHPAQEENHA